MRRFSSSMFLIFAMLALCMSAGSAQGVFALNSQHNRSAGEGAGVLPGSGGDFRLQILVSAARLRPLVGRTLTELHFRRSQNLTMALASGTVDVRVFMSPARTTPDNPSATFASNHGPNPMKVHDAGLTLPVSPKIAAPVTNPWRDSNLVRIVFSNRYAYSGGDLCIEIRGRPRAPSPGFFWPIDHEAQDSGGKEVRFGAACAGWTQSKTTAFGSAQTLRVGGTTWIKALGRTNTVPLLLLGTRRIDPGLDLGFLGAPTCKQYVYPLLLMPGAYRVSPRPPIPAILALPLKLPRDQSLMGQSFVVQVVDDERALPSSQWSNAAAMSTSNGVMLTISANAPDLGLATVRSRTKSYGQATQLPWGEVDVGSAPVMRFRYR